MKKEKGRTFDDFIEELSTLVGFPCEVRLRFLADGRFIVMSASAVGRDLDSFDDGEDFEGRLPKGEKVSARPEYIR